MQVRDYLRGSHHKEQRSDCKVFSTLSSRINRSDGSYKATEKTSLSNGNSDLRLGGIDPQDRDSGLVIKFVQGEGVYINRILPLSEMRRVPPMVSGMFQLSEIYEEAQVWVMKRFLPKGA